MDLSQPEEEWFSQRTKNFRNQWRKALKDYSIQWVESDEERQSLYSHYFDFAKQRRLAVPNPVEETELEWVQVRNTLGELEYAAAFLPIHQEKRMRYRYGMHLKSGLAGKAALAAALTRARLREFQRFDFGGITLGARPGSTAYGINEFKKKFGGNPEVIWMHVRSRQVLLRFPLYLGILGLRSYQAIKRRIDVMLTARDNFHSEC